MMPAESNSWTFHNPVLINFGSGIRAQLPRALTGPFAVVTTGRARKRIEADEKLKALTSNPAIVWLSDVAVNPDVRDVQLQIDGLRNRNITEVVAVGGGSVMDTAKALAVCLGKNAPRDLRELLSVPKALEVLDPLPLYAIPTTAGTGSEVTPFATLWDGAGKRKLSLAGPQVFPKAAYVDPELTLGLPKEITLSAGLDAINQAAESIWNRNANPITLHIARRALHLGLTALPRLRRSPDDRAARSMMMECSLLAGLAISHTRTALCHSISYPLTSHFGVPHGLACAFSMAAVFNLNAGHDDGRLHETARFLDLRNVGELGNVVANLLRDLEVVARVKQCLPPLAELELLVPEMFTPGRADNNLAPVDQKVILGVLRQSYSAP